MDPETCYLEMIEAMNAADHRSAREKALELSGWFDKGGFYPPNHRKAEIDETLASVLRKTAYLQSRS